MYQHTKRQVHILLHPELGESRWDKIINGFIITLIILNVIAVILETVPYIHDHWAVPFHYFDLVSVLLFTVEFMLRLWSCTEDPRYTHPVKGRLKYLISTEAIIDLLAFLPFYVHVFSGLDLRVLRMLRLFRFLRLFQLTAYMKSAQMVKNVFVHRASELKLSIVLISIMIVISSSLLYFAEHEAQPDVFKSIPATFWWAVVTVTSVGYGDMVPVTTVGKILTGIITLTGLAIFALPVGIITAGFMDEFRKLKEKKVHRCPHCHEVIDLFRHTD